MTTKNVLGNSLETCCKSPMTGFFRTGCCETSAEDRGLHLVCAQVTAEFLAFSKKKGNDLITPVPMFGFQGLKPGDKWCICVARWQEALKAGFAPPVILASTHEKTLEYIPIEVLQEHSLINN